MSTVSKEYSAVDPKDGMTIEEVQEFLNDVPLYARLRVTAGFGSQIKKLKAEWNGHPQAIGKVSA